MLDRLPANMAHCCNTTASRFASHRISASHHVAQIPLLQRHSHRQSCSNIRSSVGRTAFRCEVVVQQCTTPSWHDLLCNLSMLSHMQHLLGFYTARTSVVRPETIDTCPSLLSVSCQPVPAVETTAAFNLLLPRSMHYHASACSRPGTFLLTHVAAS